MSASFPEASASGGKRSQRQILRAPTPEDCDSPEVTLTQDPGPRDNIAWAAGSWAWDLGWAEKVGGRTGEGWTGSGQESRDTGKQLPKQRHSRHWLLSPYCGAGHGAKHCTFSHSFTHSFYQSWLSTFCLLMLCHVGGWEHNDDRKRQNWSCRPGARRQTNEQTRRCVRKR